MTLICECGEPYLVVYNFCLLSKMSDNKTMKFPLKLCLYSIQDICTSCCFLSPEVYPTISKCRKLISTIYKNPSCVVTLKIEEQLSHVSLSVSYLLLTSQERRDFSNKTFKLSYQLHCVKNFFYIRISWYFKIYCFYHFCTRLPIAVVTLHFCFHYTQRSKWSCKLIFLTNDLLICTCRLRIHRAVLITHRCGSQLTHSLKVAWPASTFYPLPWKPQI